MARGLQRAVAVEQPRPAGAACRMRVHERDQRFQRAGMHHGVAVEQQHVAPAAGAIPWLLARAKPTFSRFSISCTRGKRSRTMAALPSVEALSTTNVSTLERLNV